MFIGLDSLIDVDLDLHFLSIKSENRPTNIKNHLIIFPVRLPLLNNQPPEEQLQASRKKKLELLKSLEYAKHLPDKGEALKKKLVEVENDISRLTKEVAKEAASKPILHNTAWANMQGNLGKISGDQMLKMFCSNMRNSCSCLI